MRARTAYVLTIFVGAALLGSLLWSNALLDGLSFLFSLVSLGFFFLSLLTSLVFLLFKRSKVSLHLFFINILICLLVFPTLRLGTFLKDRLFIMHLSEFQEATDFLINSSRESNKAEGFYTSAQLPDRYSNLHVAKSALLHFTDQGVTVSYLTRDSSAVGHSGYIYRSDDDPVALKKESPQLGLKRLAPHWFFFSD